jgi:hypothetical protein
MMQSSLLKGNLCVAEVWMNRGSVESGTVDPFHPLDPPDPRSIQTAFVT